MELSKGQKLDLYRNMCRARRFEQETADNFEIGNVQGFVHISIGEEAVPAGVCANLRKEDYITSTHRGHCHVLLKGADANLMMAELFGRADGYNKGKGGSMHIASVADGVLGANGIVGAGALLAAGAGLAARIRKQDIVTVCFFGDGAANEGAVHESMNAAALYNLPIVYVCTNNLYGISTRQDRSMKIENISDRAVAYGMPGVTADGNDVLQVYEVAREAIQRARSGGGPSLLEFKSYRWSGHFVGDPDFYRPKEELAEWKAKDPIKRMKEHLVKNGIASEEEVKAIEKEVKQEMKDAVAFALSSPFPGTEAILADVYTDIVEEGR